MTRRGVVLGVWLLGISLISPARAGLESLQYLSEEYKPFNYTQPSGHPAGLAVELLERIWKRTRTQPQVIRFLPWARAYQRLQLQPGTVLFSTARTRTRDPLFHWACPIARTPIVLLALRSRQLHLDNLQQLATYHVMAVRADVGEQLLHTQTDSWLKLDTTHNLELALKQLRAGRIDVLSFNERVARQVWQEMGEQDAALQTLWSLGEQEFCFAFSPGTSTQLIAQFRQALQQEVSSEGYPQLLERYQLRH